MRADNVVDDALSFKQTKVLRLSNTTKLTNSIQFSKDRMKDTVELDRLEITFDGRR